MQTRTASRPLVALLMIVVLQATLFAVGCRAPSSYADEAGRGVAARLDILAAASLADVVAELVAAFEAQLGADEQAATTVSFAASNALARQIVAGAPADVFLSADRLWAEHVVERGVAERNSLERFAGNRLVVVAPRGRAATPEGLQWPDALFHVERLAIADPEGVPAGRYARQWLEGRGLWAPLEERVVPMLDVRAALYSVASGSVDAGIVYATDAAAAGLAAKQVAVVYEIGGEAAPEIGYWSVLVADETGGQAASSPGISFQRFLKSATGQAVLESHGFLVAPSSAREG